MKKTIFITLGALLILTVLAVWVYLFLYGKPADTREVFTRFGFTEDSTEEPVIETPTVDTADTLIDTSSKRLRQLTTRPVAGAGFTNTGIRYVEQGTGHVYEIELTTGKEKLISGTTIPRTTDAVFSPNALRVAISASDASTFKTIVGSISTTTESNGQIDGVELPPDATEIQFSDDGSTLYYMLKNTTGAVGYTYVLDTEANRAVFNIPLRDVHVLWGTPTYVYTTPTSVQTGHVYTIGAQSVLEYLTNGMPGLIATRYGAGIVATSITESERFSLAVSANGDRVDQTLPFIPEKCTTNPFNTLRVFCAVPTNIDEGVFPDDWYMGTLGYSDVLWDMDIQTGSAITLLNFLTESGREMDVQKIGADKFGVKLYFINKNDNTLWLFDRSVE